MIVLILPQFYNNKVSVTGKRKGAQLAQRYCVKIKMAFQYLITVGVVVPGHDLAMWIGLRADGPV